MSQIFTAISNVMREVGVVGKDSKNTSQGFKYRGIDAVMNALNPALINNKVFVVPTVLEQTREERINSKGTTLIYSVCKIKFTFYAEDGSFVEAITIGEGMDSGDKATNKAMSIAFKYACFQVFCIPTEELMDDPDKECHQVEPKECPKPVVRDYEKAREMIASLKWDEDKLFNGRKLEQLTDLEYTQAMNTFIAKMEHKSGK